MTDQRKYDDREINQILSLAIRGDAVEAKAPSAPDGLTLAQLQDVGRDVGLDPDRVAQAAMVFEAGQELMPRGTSLGMPTSVGRVVALPRAVTDHEWDLLVSEIRKTFSAKGVVTSQGGIREWSNGNLHVFIEPTATGHQMRMTTNKRETAMAGVAMGGFGLMFALLILIVLLGKADPGMRFAVPIFFALISGGALTSNAISLKRWAGDREQQMEHLGNHAKLLLSAPPNDEA